MKLAFTIIYCAGLIALFCWVQVALDKLKIENKLPKIVTTLIGAVLFMLTFFGGFILVNEAKKEVESDLKHAQAMYCLGTRRNGEPLTDNQCEYFQNVLNGKFYED